jgi:arylsulfatase
VKKDDRPFFAYLAYTAPHDPLHVPDSWLDKYSGAYDAGYDEISKRRYQRMIDLGIIPKTASQFKRPDFIPAWNDLTPEQKKVSARAMEIYASMIENIDHHIGRLISTLKTQGLYENTVVIFFSDNGANGATIAQYPATNQAWVERNSDNRFNNLGRRGSRIGVGAGWALASMTPFRMFKGFISEGGVRSPLIVAGPGVARAGQISGEIAHVRDIMPTVLDIAGITQPKTYGGHAVLPIQGRSMRAYIADRADSVRQPGDFIGFELFGWRGVRKNDWKATWISRPFGVSEWELFNIANDPGETKDLSHEKPEKVIELRELWEQYASEVGVVLPEQALFNTP